MISFNLLSKLIMFPLYYTIMQYFLVEYIKTFKKNSNIKLSFLILRCQILYHFFLLLFLKHELNDRIILERNLTQKHKCIIIGGGIGFVPAIVNKTTKNKVMIFEINKKIINNLNSNLLKNKVKFQVFNSNLLLNNNDKKKYYYSNQNFLATSMYRKTKKKIKLKNTSYKKIKKINSYNTLIIDGEGIEKHYIENISVLNKIRFIFFEFHNDIFSDVQKSKIFQKLNSEGFYLKDKFINSYYFIKN